MQALATASRSGKRSRVIRDQLGDRGGRDRPAFHHLLQVSPGKFIPVWLLDRYRFVESAKFSAV
jgi:hypothetical protein